MPMLTTPSRVAAWRITAFAIAVTAAAGVGRVGFYQESGLALYWPAAGVIVLWALTIRSRIEYVAFVALTMVILSILNLRTGFELSEALLLSLSNVALGLITRWTSLALVPLGRRFGLRAAVPSSDRSHTIIARMAVTYDVFRLFGAAFVGASLAWGVTALGLIADGRSPTFVDGAVWVVRSLASVMLITSTGLALMHRPGYRRETKAVDTIFAFALTIVFAAIAQVMSPYLPLAMMILIPLFWSGVRSTTSVAALHAVFTTVTLLAMVAGTRGAVFGLEYSTLALSARLHLMVILTFLISLVVATAVNEFVRLNADLTALADTAGRRETALRTVTETIPDALLTVDQHGRATPLNTSGTTFVRADGEGHLQLVSWPGHRPAEQPDLTPSARALRGETVVAEPFIFTDRSGTQRTFELTAAPLLPEESEDSERALLLIRDVSENHRFLSELERLANSDPLTGLPNRRRFDKALAEHIADQGPTGGVLVFDLDGFKNINDTFGHAFGDGVLIDIAGILTDTTDDADVLTRLGGDEFAILVPDGDRERLESLATALVDRTREYSRTLDGAGRELSVSVGGVTIASAMARGVAPLVAADRLMYDVKYSGRDNIVILGDHDAPEDRITSPYEWKVRLEKALLGDDLQLHLQPILDVESGRIVGAEALVRLLDDGRVVPPSQFVPIAERSGIITQMDIWVVREAIRMIARLRELDEDLSIWINFSAHSIGSTDLERVLFEESDARGVPPSAVVLELTETAKLDEVAAARTYAKRVRDRGFRLAIDDFGTGFGSLLYMKIMLFDYVKIDGEFIANLDSSATDRAIVRSLVDLAGKLGMDVVAEHVGSDAVLDVVRDEGIHLAQGFGIGRPYPEAEFVRRFLQGR